MKHRKAFVDVTAIVTLTLSMIFLEQLYAEPKDPSRASQNNNTATSTLQRQL
jgi:hypothetical protein